MRQPGQRRVDPATHGVVRVDHHLGQQRIERIEQRIGQPVIQPGPAQNRAGAIVDHRAQRRFLRFEQRAGAAQQAVDHRGMAPVGNQPGQDLAQQRGKVDPFDLAAERGFGRATDPFGIERGQDLGNQAGDPFADAAGAPRRIGQPAADHPRRIQPLQPPRHDLGGQEIGAQECRHAVGDAILVGRDDRGVRDRQAQRMAEQRGYRKPVGQSADHRRLGKGGKIAPRRPFAAVQPGQQEREGHHRQQRGRHDPGAARRVRSQPRPPAR